jgi:2,4-dienoyl-CoA reductase-like NADH-dependent reductase (Old Yellow Enzyme family)
VSQEEIMSTNAPRSLAGDLAPLFRSFKFGGQTLRNRVVMAPMTRRHSPNGVPGREVAAYYARRACGGVGLIITEGVYIDHPGAPALTHVPVISGYESVAAWRDVVDVVHAAGASIACQLWHTGPGRTLGLPPCPAEPGYGPADVRVGDTVVVKAMTTGEIAEVAASYARGARQAQLIGFDGVEIHGAHGYLLDAFLWPQTNTRTDAYGGSIENRVRFAVEVVTAIREAVGREFPVIFRFSQWKSADYAARIAENPVELAAILRPLADAGVDIFHASTRRFWEPAFPGAGKTLAALARELTGRPVIGVGSVGLDRPHESLAYRQKGASTAAGVASLAPLIEAMSRGDFDLVAVGRAMLADPAWTAKVFTGDFEQIQALEPHCLTTLT